MGISFCRSIDELRKHGKWVLRSHSCGKNVASWQVYFFSDISGRHFISGFGICFFRRQRQCCINYGAFKSQLQSHSLLKHWSMIAHMFSGEWQTLLPRVSSQVQRLHVQVDKVWKWCSLNIHVWYTLQRNVYFF
jgi:hypothetical protein